MKNHRASLPLIVVALLFAATAFAATQAFAGTGKQSQLWRRIEESAIRTPAARQTIPSKYLIFRVNRTALKNSLAELSAVESETTMAIPLPDGSIANFKMRNAPLLSAELAAQYPDWQTFEGTSIDDPTAIGRFDYTELGFHGYITTSKGIVMIDPLSQNDQENYLVFYKHDYADANNDFYCTTERTTKTENQLAEQFDFAPETRFSFGRAFTSIGANVRTFRLAIATTGEWSRNAAGFGADPNLTPQQIRDRALAVVVTSVNRLNGIYTRELASTFQLVNPPTSDNARNIIYDDPDNDPYNNTDQSDDNNGNVDQLRVNQSTINARVGNNSFDIGHLYGTGGGGVASRSSLCDNAIKAQGYSARDTNTGDPFVVDYVAHEFGHQFGALHTYNNVDPSGTCTTRSAESAYEPASGATIMSYVGICAARNLQQFVDTGFPSFHIRSLTEIIENFQTGDPATTGCGTTAGTNNIPTVSAGANYTIPILTPFTLTAAGADADANDVPGLLYSWEQYDRAPSASGARGTPANTFDVDTDGVARPLFRAYSPVANNARTFPSLNFILNPAANDPAGSNQPRLEYTGTHPTNAPGAVCEANATCVIGERLPTISRAMNFRVSVRDRRGGVADAGTIVTATAAAGPFQITVQNSFADQSFAPQVNWRGGSQQTVTWDVANTNAAPVNAANVNILLSTDGGQTFPITIIANTPNDGSETIVVPNNPTATARIKVEAVGNVFFDINNANFRIISATAAAVSISGRVFSAAGKAVSRASINLTDENGVVRTARTNAFGYYRFTEVPAGQTYAFEVTHKHYRFSPRAASISASLDDFDFTADN